MTDNIDHRKSVNLFKLLGFDIEYFMNTKDMTFSFAIFKESVFYASDEGLRTKEEMTNIVAKLLICGLKTGVEKKVVDNVVEFCKDKDR